MVGLRKRNEVTVREEFYLPPGNLWREVKHLEEVSITWESETEPEVIEEMLQTFLNFAEKLGIAELNISDPSEISGIKIPVRVAEIKESRFEEIAAKLAMDEIQLCSTENWERGTAKLSTTFQPEISISLRDMKPPHPLFHDFPEQEAICMHVKEGSIILHRSMKHPRGCGSHAVTKEGSRYYIDLSREEDVVELPWPESGIILERHHAAYLHRAIMSRYWRWLMDTERFDLLSRIEERLEKLNLLSKEEVLEIAKKALREMRKCIRCREELGDKIEKLKAAMGAYSPVVLYTPSEEEIKEFFGDGEHEWADLQLKQVCKSLADENRDAAAGSTKEKVLAPVHLNIHWNYVEIYLGHDAHPVMRVAEGVKEHIERELRMSRISYRVEYC